ncbi:YcxB family protein [Propionicimonas sp.]|uniref:YcxB family protein n=1 Tax=Propionicimonas sp. TaxID=1955623 RepID=UPI0039E22D94
MLQFEATVEDVLAGSTHTPAARSHLRRLVLDRRIHCATTAFLVAVGIRLLGSPALELTGSVVPSALGAAAVAVLVGLLSGPWARRHVEAGLRRAATKALAESGQPRRIWLDATGLGAYSPGGGTSHLDWAVIGGIEETPDHLLVRTGPVESLAIPWRTGPLDVAAFAAELRSRLSTVVGQVAVLPTIAPQDSLQFVLTEEQWVDALVWMDRRDGTLARLVRRRRRSSAAYFALPLGALLLLILTTASTTSWSGRSPSVLLGVLAGSVLIVGLAQLLIPATAEFAQRSSRRGYLALDPRPLEPTRVWASAGGVDLQRPGSWDHLEWSWITALGENRDMVILRTRTSLLAVPKAAGPIAAERFSTVAREQLAAVSGARVYA